MGGKKRNNRDRDVDDSYQKMVDDFKKKLDEVTFGDRRSSVIPNITTEDSRSRREPNFNLENRSPEIRNCELDRQREQLRMKELELKDREIELLKRQNETLEANTKGASGSNQFGFKDIEESLTKFSGDDNYSIDKWITDFEEAVECLGWSDLQAIIYAKRLLVGTAKQSLRAANDLSTWKQLTKFLTEEFRKPENSAIIHRKLADRKKKSDESYRSYLIALRELGRTANVDDLAIIQYCIDGIADYETNKSILYGARNIIEFKDKLDIYAEMRSKIKKPLAAYKPNFNQESSKHRYKKPSFIVKCYNCGGVGHLGKDCSDKSKGPKCYKCGLFGHLAPACKKEDKICATIEENCVSKDVKAIRIGGKELLAMVDNGSDLNFMAEKTFSSIGSPGFVNQTTCFRGAGSNRMQTIGRFYTKIHVDADDFDTVFHIVSDNILPYSVILGKELLSQAVTTISPEGVFIKKFMEENFLLAIEQEEDLIDISHISNKDIAEKIKSMVTNYSPKRIKNQTEIEMNIVLTSNIPIFQKPRRLSPLETNVVRKQIDDWLEEKIIRPSKSNFGSPVVLANKKDGTKRLCVDFRKLNERVVKDRYPLPLVEDQIDQLQGAKYFSTLDLKNGFFHVPIAEDSIKFTAFTVPFGHYEFLRAPFGLCNSPAVFQRFINNIFQSLCLQKILCVYMDDVVIPAVDEEQAVSRLAMVMKVAEENGLNINWKKCQFMSKSIEYLGYEIEKNKIKPSSRKTDAILKFAQPTCVKKIQSFLGLTGYFRKFVSGYAILAKPLSDLLRKDVEFNFGEQQKHSFNRLKESLVNSPVLRIYSMTAQSELHTDACKIGLGAVLLQKSDEDEQFHPVFYYSKKTSPCEERYSSYELEVLAIVTALKKFRVYLLGLKFVIATDCAAFKATMEKKNLTSRIAGWALQLHEFDFKLEHRPAHKMRHVDALSRNPIVLVIEEEDVIKKVKAAQRQDSSLKTIFTILKSGTYEDYVSNNGVLFKIIMGDLALVVPEAMEMEVIRTCHDQGHFGVKKTEELVRRQFYISKLAEKIKRYICNCIPCILTERKRGKQDGLLRPIPKGDVPLATYHVDHLGSLESTKKQYKYILCVVDGFSKFVWLYPTKTANSKEVIQKLEIQKAVFGNPKNIISDKGTAFTSAEFRDYCITEAIEHATITTGVPTGNGQVERINQIIIPALTKLSRDNPEDWYKHTSRLQRYLNNSYQRSIDLTPFELMMGVKMRCSEDMKLKQTIEEELVRVFNERRNELRNRAREKILQVQEENRKTFNKKRKKAPLYKVGDWVVIKRTQFGSGLKIKPKFLGPYQITKISGRDRYEVIKIGKTEGPIKTSTSAENIKLYYQNDSDEDDDNDNCENADGEEILSGSDKDAEGPSGITL